MKGILGYTGRFTTTYTQWGLDVESTAIQAYEDHIRPYHTDMAIKRAGLSISPSLPFLGALPDGVRSCQCHNERLVEIKCPHSHRDQEPNIIILMCMVTSKSIIGIIHRYSSKCIYCHSFTVFQMYFFISNIIYYSYSY